MKQYIDPQGLRLVGKAWEIRRQLRRLGGSRAGSRKLDELLKPADAQPSSVIRRNF